MAEPEFEARDILEWEFEYARGTAEQSQDDRTAIMNLYLVLVGAVGSVTLALPQLGGAAVPREAYGVLLGAIALIGFFVLMTLVRLRQAWYDSALAMNRIKDFYRAKFPELDSALRWRTETIPPPGKLWTITFNLSLLVMLTDSISLGLAMYFVSPRLPFGEYTLFTFGAVVFLLWQLWFYFIQLPVDAK
jgi:membrane protein YdbS with pleckstrin-like domain